MNDVLLILSRGARAHGGMKTASLVFELGDAPGQRRTIYMDIPNRQEDADALPGAAVERFVGHNNDSSIRRGDHGAGFGGNEALKVAQEIQHKSRQKEKNGGRPVPLEEQCDAAQDERPRGKQVSFFYHLDSGKSYALLRCTALFYYITP